MKPMLKADFFTAVKNLLVNGFRPTFYTINAGMIGVLAFNDKNGNKQVEQVYSCSSQATSLMSERFRGWFSAIDNEFHAAQAEKLNVGDKVKDGDTVRTVTAIRRTVARGENGTPKNQVCAASGVIVLDNGVEVMAGNVSPVPVDVAEESGHPVSSARSAAEQMQLTFRLSCPVTQRRTVEYAHEEAVLVEACHAVALEMEEENDFKMKKPIIPVMPSDGLTEEQGKAHHAQNVFFYQRTGAERAVEVEAAHADALQINVMVNIQRDVMAAPYLPALVEACHAEALEVNEVSTAANTDITAPLRIISDYMQRFMRSNKDAKLFEAKERLERKIAAFISDGYDEQCLRQALSAATSCHTREAFASALELEAIQ